MVYIEEFTDLGLTDTEMGTDEESSENTLESEVSQSPEQYEALTIQDYKHFAISFIPVGALSGAVFMMVGLALLGIVRIFKKL